MHHWKRTLLALAAPLLLTGCLWGPGKFASALDVRKDGSFTLDYRGEIVLAMPEEPKAEPWTAAMARCFTDGRVETGSSSSPPGDEPQRRACTAAELAKAKADHDRDAARRAATKAKESAEMAKLFGLPGLDDDSARAFASKLTKYAGWRSVVYRGRGVFDVDYHFVGRASQDFMFPALPDNALIIPFIAIRRRSDGAVLITAPAMAGKGAFPGAGAGPGSPTDGPASRAHGRLIVTTDGDVLTNNSEEGPTRNAAGQQLQWDVTPSLGKVPETLIRLR
jgi:hypothetical protein